MSYNRMGGFKVNGKSRRPKQKNQQQVEAERQTAVLCTKGGMLRGTTTSRMSSSSLCGNRSATVVGELITYDSRGQVAGLVQLVLSFRDKKGHPRSRQPRLP